MKITFILGGLKGGGAERVASILMNYWIEKDIDVTLISMRGEEKDAYRISENVGRVVLGGEGESSNKLIALAKNLLYLTKLRKAIKQTDSEIVISFITRANIYSIFACYGLNKRVVISERNDISRQTLRWPWPWLREKLYRFADMVTANSKVAVESMKSFVPESKLRFVPNPVELPEPNKLSSPDQSKKLLNVSRLAEHKRQVLIVQAFGKIKSSFSDWNLQILGRGGERDHLIEEAKKEKIESQVELPGFVDNPEDYYSSSAIFVLSSLYEGTPNALLEAMSFGLPSIVSDSLPGAMEWIEDGKTGFVFESENAEDLSKKMKTLMQDPELRLSMGRAARDKVEALSLDKVATVWENIILKNHTC